MLPQDAPAEWDLSTARSGQRALSLAVPVADLQYPGDVQFVHAVSGVLANAVDLHGHFGCVRSHAVNETQPEGASDCLKATIPVGLDLAILNALPSG